MVIFKLWRCVPADIIYKLAGAEKQKKIDADMEQYLKTEAGNKRKGLSALNFLLLSGDKTFRSVFYYRLGRPGKLCKLFLPPVKAVEIYGEIAGGLCLSHNHMVVHPHTAGKNLHVCAGAVIGKNNGHYPTIGDNVYIGANSTVIGDIVIGSDVIILPGTVVTKSLPQGAVCGGNPMQIIKDAKR
ncbi:MAG: hypothetical protein J5590_06975 [Clostridia bacterium]|nr:hypothetical protein [Clostridia bacterium]